MKISLLMFCGVLLVSVARLGEASPAVRPDSESRFHDLFELFFVGSVERYDYTANIMSGHDPALARMVEETVNTALNSVGGGGDVEEEAMGVIVALKKALSVNADSYPAYARYRKLGDEYRVDMTSGALAELLVLPESFEFETTDSWFVDDVTGVLMKYYTYGPYKSISLEQAPPKFSDRHWEAFVCDRMIAAAFVLPLMKKMDAERVRHMAPEEIEDLIEMDPIAAQELVQGTHPAAALNIAAIDGGRQILTLREKPGEAEYVRLVCASDDLRTVFFARLQDPSTRDVLCASVRAFGSGGELKAYAAYESIPNGPKKFRFAELATSFHHTDPVHADFTMSVPEGWTLTDRTDPSAFVFYENGKEVGRKPKKKASAAAPLGAERRSAVFYFLILFMTFVFVRLASRGGDGEKDA